MTPTPEQKANTLVNKFVDQLEYKYDNRRVLVNNARNCAIICIDEILVAISGNFLSTESHFYWKSVKEELSKL